MHRMFLENNKIKGLCVNDVFLCHNYTGDVITILLCMCASVSKEGHIN